jgi:hypothetical protein
MISWNLVRRLDNWRFWMLIAYIGLCGFGLALWHDNQKTNATAQKNNLLLSERRADITANAESQYQQCVKSIPTLVRVNRFLHAVEDVHLTLLQNSRRTHAVTPPGSPIYKAQIKNIQKLKQDTEAVRHVRFPVPTMAKCKALRAKLKARH